MSLSKSQREKVERALAQHAKHKNCYFWTPPVSAGQRRYTEQQNNWSVEFKHDGDTYTYESEVRCSCKNYYYRGEFAVNGKKKTIRVFWALLEG